MKRIIKLKESELRNIIYESVKGILNESRFDKNDNYPRLPCEKSHIDDIPPGDEDVYYPGDINPDVWDALQRGDYGEKSLHEEMSPEDKWAADEEADEEMRYDMGELTKAFQKANGTYQATSMDGKFKTGDKVIVHTRKGDIQGVISDFSENFMTYEETADVDFKENGQIKTLISCPLNKIEKIR